MHSSGVFSPMVRCNQGEKWAESRKVSHRAKTTRFCWLAAKQLHYCEIIVISGRFSTAHKLLYPLLCKLQPGNWGKCFHRLQYITHIRVSSRQEKLDLDNNRERNFSRVDTQSGLIKALGSPVQETGLKKLKKKRWRILKQVCQNSFRWLWHFLSLFLGLNKWRQCQEFTQWQWVTSWNVPTNSDGIQGHWSGLGFGFRFRVLGWGLGLGLGLGLVQDFANRKLSYILAVDYFVLFPE